MKKQMKWGIVTLLLLLGIAAVFIFLDQNAELQQLEKETAKSGQLRQERNKPQETPQDVNKQELDTSHPDYHVPEDGTPHIDKHDKPIVEVSEVKMFSEEGVEIPSAEELARVREFQKELFPQMIEQLRSNVAGLEKRYNILLKQAQLTPIPGHYDNELAKAKANLDGSRLRLRSLQNVLKSILNGTHPGDKEAKEASNETK